MNLKKWFEGALSTRIIWINPDTGNTDQEKIYYFPNKPESFVEKIMFQLLIEWGNWIFLQVISFLLNLITQSESTMQYKLRIMQYWQPGLSQKSAK